MGTFFVKIPNHFSRSCSLSAHIPFFACLEPTSIWFYLASRTTSRPALTHHLADLLQAHVPTPGLVIYTPARCQKISTMEP
jgi:hypothetical protein